MLSNLDGPGSLPSIWHKMGIQNGLLNKWVTKYVFSTLYVFGIVLGARDIVMNS